jgi:hypothetical protein
MWEGKTSGLNLEKQNSVDLKSKESVPFERITRTNGLQ